MRCITTRAQARSFPSPKSRATAWSWLRLDLSYWDGDRVHLELYTGQDAPIEVSGSDRSWFGVREVRLRKKGAGKPADPVVSGQVFEEVPQSKSRACRANRATHRRGYRELEAICGDRLASSIA